MRLKCFKKCLPCLLPELWLLKCEAWLFFVFSADDSKKLVRTWAKHLSTTERSSSVNMITRQMTPFFHLYTIWTLFVDTIHFCILRPSKFSSVRSPICFMFWSVKSTVLHAKDDNFKSLKNIVSDSVEWSSKNLWKCWCKNWCKTIRGKRPGYCIIKKIMRSIFKTWNTM